MRQRIVLSLIIFCFFVVVFFLQKIVFVLVHGGVNGGVDIADILRIVYHGLSIDMSMSGYLTVIPLLLLIASVWLRPSLIVKIFNVYFGVMLSTLVSIMLVDVMLYSYWGFHLDSTALFYARNTKEIIASSSGFELLIGTFIGVLASVFLYYCYILAIRRVFAGITPPPERVYKVTMSLVMLLLAGALFLPIRGGVTVSTMNVSYAYFSNRMFLNHAAINPVFNFMYSLRKYDDFASQYQFYDKAEAEQVFNQLHRYSGNDDVPQLLRVEQPNIILFMLESFSYDVALDSVVAPNISQLAKESILFENFYASGFRTDRGIVSVLSGYPSHPTAAILKYPKKTESLPSIPKSLRQAGYENQSMYYGGDIKFANMLSYILGACGIQDIVSDGSFPVKDRLTKWGVPDESLLDRVYRDITEGTQQSPFLKVVLTLSSHEPFDVPVDKFEEPFLNSVNYTDDCIGDFISNLKSTDLWDNTLIIFVSDHAMQGYPQGVDNYEEIRFKIPMIWTGGAITQPIVVSDYGSQNDLAATLLSQLQIERSAFKFSKDMLSPQERKFSFYSYVNGFCMMDSSGIYLYDNNQQRVLEQTGTPVMEKEAKAYFQIMYIDLGNK